MGQCIGEWVGAWVGGVSNALMFGGGMGGGGLEEYWWGANLSKYFVTIPYNGRLMYS